MNAEEIIQNEKEYVLGVFGRPPFVLTEGKGSTVYDSAGKGYLDLVAGIAVNVLGYGDAEVEQAIKEAASTGMFHTSNLYHTEPHTLLAKKLCETSFADKVHYCLCGASANEGAFKFARRYAREHGHEDKWEILAFSDAFHGRLFGALAATPREKYQQPFEPLMPGVRFADFNDLDDARAKMSDKVCAIIVEPIQGEGGINPATPEFLSGLRALADEYGALLIFDEVQCGLGRSGDLWAYQGYGVEPDILSAAKPLAGGLPMGAILMKQKVADTIHPGDHASTFAGNPFTTHVACTVVDRVAQPSFLADVKEKGQYLMELLAELNSPHILEIRGAGLIVGIELDIEANPIVEKGYEAGMLLLSAGEKVVRFVPPLTISKEELALAVSKLGAILQEL